MRIVRSLKGIGVVGSLLALAFPFVGSKLGMARVAVKNVQLGIILLSLLCGGIGIIATGELTLSGRFGGSMVIGRRDSRMIGTALLLFSVAIIMYVWGARWAIPGSLFFGGAAATTGSLGLSLAYGKSVGREGYAAFALFVLGGLRCPRFRDAVTSRKCK